MQNNKQQKCYVVVQWRRKTEQNNTCGNGFAMFLLLLLVSVTLSALFEEKAVIFQDNRFIYQIEAYQRTLYCLKKKRLFFKITALFIKLRRISVPCVV